MMPAPIIQLRITSATGVHLEEPVTRIIAEANNGSFCLLPRHQDLATSLVAGLLEYTSTTGSVHYLAIDEGLLVKSGIQVSVCTRHAVRGDKLEELRVVVDEEFANLNDRESAARSAVARLEADFARRFLKLRERDHV